MKIGSRTFTGLTLLLTVGVILIGAIFTVGAIVPMFFSEKTLATVMIENQQNARPHQEGLKDALLIEEWPVEGMIARFAVVFDIENMPKRVGPVRSLRPYFLDGIAPWPMPFFHAGGSPEALEKIYASNHMMSINGIGGTYFKDFKRDTEIPAPHNLFISGENVTRLTEAENLGKTDWPPYKIGSAPAGDDATSITINFLSQDHNIQYEYQPLTGTYNRTNGDVTDHGFPKNVLVLEIGIQSIGEYGRLNIPVVGSGPATLFRSGKVYQGTWEKPKDEWFTFTTDDDKEFVFARGQTWMTVVPSLSRLSWE